MRNILRTGELNTLMLTRELCKAVIQIMIQEVTFGQDCLVEKKMNLIPQCSNKRNGSGHQPTWGWDPCLQLLRHCFNYF